MLIDSTDGTSAAMNRYRTAFQSFSIESLIGGRADDSGARKDDKDDCGGDDATTGFECSPPPSKEMRVARTTSSSAAHHHECTDVSSGSSAFGSRDRRLSTLFSSMLDTAMQQRQRLDQQQQPQPPPPLHFDYFKAMQLQSAATASKTFSQRALWPYLNEMVAFPPPPPTPLPPSCYLRPPPPVLPPLYGCPDEAFEDEDHVSSCDVTSPIVGKSAGDQMCRHLDDEDDEEDEEDDDDADEDGGGNEDMNETDVGDNDETTANPRFGKL